MEDLSFINPDWLPPRPHHHTLIISSAHVPVEGFVCVWSGLSFFGLFRKLIMPGYFLTGEHVNITQWESSHTPHAAFLFMSLNSINGLLSHRTVVVPSCGVFLREVLVAAAEKRYTIKECSLFGCSGACETLVRGLAVEFDVMLTLCVRWRSNVVSALVFFSGFRKNCGRQLPKMNSKMLLCQHSETPRFSRMDQNKCRCAEGLIAAYSHGFSVKGGCVTSAQRGLFH